MFNFKVILVLLTMVYVGHASATTLPPVPTNIVNLDKAQFVGSLVVANLNPNAANNIKPASDNLVVGFRDMAACQAFVDGFTLTFKIDGNAHSTTQASWETQTYAVLVGGCVAK